MPKPTTYTEARGLDIVSRIAEGIPLAHICREKGMPWVQTVLKWRLAHPSFDQAYMRARISSADVLVDEMQAIADDAQHAVSHEAVAAARLRIDTRKWIASKMKPQAYGDRLEVQGDMQLSIVVQKYVDVQAVKQGITVDAEP